MEVTGYLLQERVSNLTINKGVIVTTGGLYPSGNSPLSTVYTASAVVSEYGGAVILQGNNTIVTTGITQLVC